MTMDATVRKPAQTEVDAFDEQEHRGEATILSVAPPPDASHQREHSRFSVDLDVTVGSDHNFYAGFAENLSVGGVFIATHKLKTVDSRIELSINLPDGAKLRVEGQVRWIRVFNDRSDTPPGMGVKFDDLAPAAVALIQGFLWRREPLFFDDE